MAMRFRGNRVRSAGIVIKDDHILLMRRRKKDMPEYYSIPGGGVERGEDLAHAAVREIVEETTVSVSCDRLVYSYTYPDINADSYYFLCQYISGEPHLDPTSEEAICMTDDNQFHPMWFPIKKLSQTRMYPLEVRDRILEHIQTGFPEQAETVVMDSAEIRQDI